MGSFSNASRISAQRSLYFYLFWKWCGWRVFPVQQSWRTPTYNWPHLHDAKFADLINIRYLHQFLREDSHVTFCLSTVLSVLRNPEMCDNVYQMCTRCLPNCIGGCMGHLPLLRYIYLAFARDVSENFTVNQCVWVKGIWDIYFWLNSKHPRSIRRNI